MDLNLLSLNIRRGISRFLQTGIHSTVYTGLLKGYRLLADTNINYFDSSYESGSFSYILDQLKINPCLVIYDLGANVGYFALLCNAASLSRATIYAFEPVPKNMAMLCDHLILNKTKNIFPISVAISDKQAIVDFSANNQSVSYTYKKSSDYYGERDLNLKVCTMSIDGLTRDFNFLLPNILKIDVEGAEYDVLKGAEKTLMEVKPMILLSTHNAHVPGIEKDCLEMLTSLSYDCLLLPNEIGRMPGLNDYWCTPKRAGS